MKSHFRAWPYANRCWPLLSAVALLRKKNPGVAVVHVCVSLRVYRTIRFEFGKEKNENSGASLAQNIIFSENVPVFYLFEVSMSWRVKKKRKKTVSIPRGECRVGGVCATISIFAITKIRMRFSFWQYPPRPAPRRGASYSPGPRTHARARASHSKITYSRAYKIENREKETSVVRPSHSPAINLTTTTTMCCVRRAAEKVKERRLFFFESKPLRFFFLLFLLFGLKIRSIIIIIIYTTIVARVYYRKYVLEWVHLATAYAHARRTRTET